MAEGPDAGLPRLTRTVQKGGCAAKLAAGTVSDLLRGLPRQAIPTCWSAPTSWTTRPPGA